MMKNIKEKSYASLQKIAENNKQVKLRQHTILNYMSDIINYCSFHRRNSSVSYILYHDKI